MSLERLFSIKLKQHLEPRGVTQISLAKAINVDQSTISKFANAIKIANFFDLNLDGFLDINKPKEVGEQRRLLYQFLNEQQELIKKYLPPKGVAITVKAQESGGRVSRIMISCDYSAINMYPQTKDYQQLAPHTIYDNYLIVNDNIYPERHFEMVWGYENGHVSFYDYVNSILDGAELHDNVEKKLVDRKERYKDLRKMMNVYVRNRHLFGILGTLSASKFYWLVYSLSHNSKLTSNSTQ
ncbi:MAG: helix-turn-helix transcriptional regulator [Defluviitaleaceae bacterium]|nr:helix-turn-helix transcriptional regulator [Defluviitaleaceae bacterium]